MSNASRAAKRSKTARGTESVSGSRTLSSRDDYRALGERTARAFGVGSRLDGSSASGNVLVADCFCGAGGLSTGFEIVGRSTGAYQLRFAADLDTSAIATYQRNLGLAPHLIDLGAMASNKRGLESIAELVGKKANQRLVLVGGPPCQGFSAHRKKDADVIDERNSLVAAYAKIAAFLQPDFVVLENVPELLSEKHWHLFEKFRTTLQRNGYVVKARIHDLAGFGVPQHRFRALVLACKRDFRFPEPFLRDDEFVTVRDAIGSLPRVAHGECADNDPFHVSARHRESTLSIIRQIPKNGGSRPPNVGPRCLQGVDGFRDVYGRLRWDRPANTITTYARNPASGRFVHPEQDRGLSIREAALLQTFPSNFQFEGSFDEKFRQIGNAVPVAFAAYLAAHILGELRHPVKAIETTDDLAIVEPLRKSFSSAIPGLKRRTSCDEACAAPL